MAGGRNPDFYVRFGSNASQFAEELKSGVTPAKATIKSLADEVERLNGGLSKSSAKLQSLLGADLARRGGGGGGDDTPPSGGGGGGGQEAFYRSLTDLTQGLKDAKLDLANEVKGIITALGKVAPAVKKEAESRNKSAAQQERLRDKRGNFVNPGTGRVLGSATTQTQGSSGRHKRQQVQKLAPELRGTGKMHGPEISNKQHAELLAVQARMGKGSGTYTAETANRVLAALGKSQAEVTRAVAQMNAPAPDQRNITTAVEISGGSLDAGFDRVVRSLDAIKATLERVSLKGVTAKQVNEAQAAKKGGKKTKTAKVEESAAEAPEGDLDARMAAVEAQASQLKARAARMRKMLESATGEVADVLKAQLDNTEKGLAEVSQLSAAMKSERAKSEREELGISRTEQKQRNQEKAKEEAAPDLPEEEFNRRVKALERIQMAADPDFLERASKRGRGGISGGELREIASEYGKLGLGPEAFPKSATKQQIAASIMTSRQGYEQRYGAGVPEELRVGRKLIAGKVSDFMKGLIGDINKAATVMLEDKAVRQTLSQMGLAGGTGLLPDKQFPGREKTGRGLRVEPGGATSSGFGPYDVQGEQARRQAEAHFADISEAGLKQVAEQMRNPEFNPHDPKLYDEITKGNADDEVAKAATIAFNTLRRTTNIVDDLGDEYMTLGEALEETLQFIDRANNRLDRERQGLPLTKEQQEKVKTDPENIRKSAVAAQRLSEAMGDPKFDQFRDIFESPGYIQGRAQRFRTQELSQQAAQKRDAERHFSRVTTEEALGEAILNRRLAPGTKDTYISDLGPRAGFDRRAGYTLQDATGEEKKKLRELNREARSFAASLRGEAQFEAGDPALERQRKKTENKATAMLNSLEELFGRAPEFEKVVGRAPELDTNIAAEARRQRTRDELEGRRTKKFTAPTSLEVAAQREKDLAHSEALLAQNTKELAAARKEAKRKADAAKKVTEARSPEEQGAIAARRAAEARIAKRAYALTPAEAFPGVETTFRRGSQGVVDKLGLIDRAKRGERISDEDIQRISDFREYRANYELSRKAGDQELVNLPKVPVSPQEQASLDAERRVAQLEAREKTLNESIARRQGGVAEAREKAKVSATGRTLDTKTGRVVADSAEAKLLRKEISALEKYQAEIKRLRDRKEKALKSKNADAIAAARTELNEYRKEQQAAGMPVKIKPELSQRRKRLWALNREAEESAAKEAAAAGGAGGTGGGGKKAAAPGSPPPGGGGGTNDLLRQILAAINKIDNRLGRGVKVTERSAEAPGSRAARKSAKREQDERLAIPDKEAERAKHGTDMEQQIAFAAQQRRLHTGQGPIQNWAQWKAANPDDEQEVLDRAYKEKKNREATEKSNTAEKQRNSEATRKQAREALALAKAQDKLDAESKQELATLHQMNVAGAKATDIVKQQARAYAALDARLKKMGMDAATRRQTMRPLFSQAMGGRVSAGEIEEIGKSSRVGQGGSIKDVDQNMARQAQQQMPGGFFGGESMVAQAMFGNHGFWSRVMHSTGTFVVRNFTAGFVFGLTNALQEIMRQAIITESTFIRVSDALEQTGRSSGNLRTQLQSISSDYGTNLEDVYTTAAGLTGMFDGIDEIAGATRVVSQLQAISMGALNAQEAMGVLASITGAYGADLGHGVTGLEEVADVLTVVQNTLGTNIEVTSEGVGRMSGLAQQLKIDFQDTAVYVGQIAKLTNQTGAAAGEQFSRILAVMQSGRGRTALAKALPNMGIEGMLGAGEYGAALKTLMQNWDGLSESQQRNLATTLAGQRQAAAFAALMNNNNKVLAASEAAHAAQGEAAERAKNIAETLNGQIARLNSNLQNLAQNLVRTGILNWAGAAVMGLNKVLSLVNKLFSMFNDTADANPVVRMFKDITIGIVGLIAALKLGQMAFRGFRASLVAMKASEGVIGSGINAATAVGQGRSLRESVVSAPRRAGDWVGTRAASYQGRSSTGRRAGTMVGTGPAAKLVQGPLMASGAFYASESQKITRAQKAMQASGNLTARSLRGVGSGLERLNAAGLGAQVGIMAAITAILMGVDALREAGAREEAYKELYDPNYDPEGKKKDSKRREQEYTGPWGKLYDQNLQETEGGWNRMKVGMGAYLQGWSPESLRGGSKLETARNVALQTMAPGMDLLGGLGLLPQKEGTSALDRARGVLRENVQKRIDDIYEMIDSTLTDIDPRATGFMAPVATIAPWATEAMGLGEIENPRQTIREAEKARDKINERVEAERKKINESTDSPEQKTHALAQLDEVVRKANERVSSLMLMAQGILEQDILSTEQLAMVASTRSMLSGLATGGGGIDAQDPKYKALFEQLIADTGARPESKMGASLTRLSKGRMTKAEAIQEEMKSTDAELEQLQAKYLAAAQGTGDRAYEDTEVEAMRQQIIAGLEARAGQVTALIEAFMSDANAIADAAAAAGDFAGAAAALAGGITAASGVRNRNKEDEATRAARDLAESQGAERVADLASKQATLDLEAAKASGVGSQRGAQLEEQIAAARYNALLDSQRAARAAGKQGPSIEAIAQAKNAWISAQHSSAMAAQDANIAAMTAAAAGIWNGVAAAAAQEGIALQQYANAKANFGANSAEALNALASYRGAQKASIQAQDQVAEARRQAHIASIPQGAGVRVARAQVGAARAAVAAARKYGQNSTEYQGALAQLYSAQQAATQAQGAVRQAHIQLAQAQAEARGNTVAAARAGQRLARAQLRQARRMSGGRNSAEVLAARAQVVQARAATRDAMLQDRLDTIDFNLQMGKITQSSAIQAMRQILRTSNLTKQQRRDLMLRIKGMKDSLNEGPWNFGDIALPSPYQMRRYITREKQLADAELRGRIGAAIMGYSGPPASATSNVVNETTVQINGADVAAVRRILQDILGKSTKTRTTQGRRR